MNFKIHLLCFLYLFLVYKTDMDQDISGDCRGDFGDLVMALCKTERDPGSGVSKEQAQNDAKALYKVCRL